MNLVAHAKILDPFDKGFPDPEVWSLYGCWLYSGRCMDLKRIDGNMKYGNMEPYQLAHHPYPWQDTRVL